MTTEQDFVLDWKTHFKQFTSAFRGLYTSSELTDVTLCVEGKKIKTHRLILSICSKYFESIFKDYQHTKDLVIVLTDVRYKIMLNILQFIYMGEVQLQKGDLPEFVQTATKLEIATFVEQNEQALTENKSVNVVDNAIIDVDSAREPAVETTNNIPAPKLRERAKKVVQKKVTAARVKNAAKKKVATLKKKVKAKKVVNVKKTLPTPIIDAVPDIPPTPEFKLDESYLSVEVNPLHQCPICGQTQESLDDLKLHVKEHEVATPKPTYTCILCGSNMRSREMLQIHLVHHQIPTSCKTCDVIIKTQNGLLQHLQKRHNYQNIFKYVAL